MTDPSSLTLISAGGKKQLLKNEIKVIEKTTKFKPLVTNEKTQPASTSDENKVNATQRTRINSQSNGIRSRMIRNLSSA